MGKKGKRSGYGGSGGGGNAKSGSRGAPAAASSGLVVINPALMQSLLVKPTPAAIPNESSMKKSTTVNRKRMREDEPQRPPSKKAAPANSSANAPPSKRVAHGSASHSEVIRLQVAREDQALAGLYWVLLTRTDKRSAVVVLPNAHATLQPPQLAHTLKSLGFLASAIHSKMPPSQRKQTVQRFVEDSAAGGHGTAEKLVLVTNQHHISSASCASADLVTLGNNAAASTKFASGISVQWDTVESATATAYEPPLSNPSIQQLQARLKVASQISAIVQRLGASSSSTSEDADSKWANKLAKGADLSDDEDGGAKKKHTKGNAPNPHEQRIKALHEKLLVLLAREVVTTASTPASLTGPLPSGAAVSSSSSDDAQHRAEKLKILGISMLSAAAGMSLGDGERLSAQTQWLDGASGSQYGGDWTGPVRHGASKDTASLAVRKQVCSCLSSKRASSSHLHVWRPNRQPVDTEAWGGEYGKACGHNEVAMHHLRPFFPQEVLNSRVCSRRQPAPGNQGFDGCLEFLRLACLDGRRAMTVWDAEYFVFITANGRVACVKKLQLLTLPLAGLQTLMANLRVWTIVCHGRKSPILLLEGIRLCCRLGAEEVKSSRLKDAKLVRRVLAFAIGGSARVWNQISSKLPRPIASEVVYDVEK